MKKPFLLNLLFGIALVVLVAGAGFSFVLVLRAGHNNKSVLLPLLFVGWVLSPFIAFMVVNVFARRWPDVPRITLYCLMLVITSVSVAAYNGAFSAPGAKLTGVFLIVPLLSWILMAIIIPVALSRSRKALARRDDSN